MNKYTYLEHTQWLLVYLVGILPFSHFIDIERLIY